MATLRDLKRRIRSVKNTEQITKAMSMVAAAKLRRAQQKVGAARPYAEKLSEVLSLVAASQAAQEHPFFQAREGDREAILLMTSDRGLCGSFNTNLCRTVEKRIEAKSKTQLIVLGRKGTQYFKFRRLPIAKSFVDLGDQVDPSMVQTVNRAAVELFDSGSVDRVLIASTQFHSVAKRTVSLTPFLPIATPKAAGENGASKIGDYIFEPSESEIFDEIIPRYTYALFYSVLAESFAAEHSARMIAMNNATKNAGELIETLTLKANRLRQASITAELADIVGAVEALA